MRHEIGHCLNLSHSWSSDDYCDDTPVGYEISSGVYGQCDDWSSNTNSPCNNWANVSNNSMDYNVYSNALTPCQIGRIHDHLNGWGNQFVHSCDGCPPVNSFFDLSGCFKIPTKTKPPGSQQVGSELYLNGEASFNEDQYKIEICEVAALNSSNCIGGYYNSGWLSGQIGKIDLKSMYTFSANKYYKVTLSVASNACPGTSSTEKYFQILSGSCNTYNYFNIQTSPNPARSSLMVKYTIEEATDLEILLLDNIGNLVKSIPKQKYLAGDQESTISTTDLREGMYFVVLKSKEKIEKKTIYVNH
jgi:Secretion system C-terminal sorting domain/Pregnancy-associated plasma protein-A